MFSIVKCICVDVSVYCERRTLCIVIKLMWFPIDWIQCQTLHLFRETIWSCSWIIRINETMLLMKFFVCINFNIRRTKHKSSLTISNWMENCWIEYAKKEYLIKTCTELSTNSIKQQTELSIQRISTSEEF